MHHRNKFGIIGNRQGHIIENLHTAFRSGRDWADQEVKYSIVYLFHNCMTN